MLRRNCFLKHIIEGKIEGRTYMRRIQERRCRQLQDDLKERRGYCKLKEEALDHTQYRTHTVKDYKPVTRLWTELMNEYMNKCQYHTICEQLKNLKGNNYCRQE
jgi:hypothetical protein